LESPNRVSFFIIFGSCLEYVGKLNGKDAEGKGRERKARQGMKKKNLFLFFSLLLLQGVSSYLLFKVLFLREWEGK
jgi:hypothetical protein